VTLLPTWSDRLVLLAFMAGGMAIMHLLFFRKR
jgi:hypothetical protein